MGPEDCGLILGGAETLWDDLSRLEEMVGGPWPGTVIATNDAGVDYPHDVHHWVTYHPEKLIRKCPPGDNGDWLAEREATGRNTDAVLWSIRAAHIVDRIYPENHGGSSGHLAVRVAIYELGLERNVLAGVPMQRRRHYHGAHDGRPWKEAKHHWPWKGAHLRAYRPHLRSLSGNTMSEFGYPSLPWFNGVEP